MIVGAAALAGKPAPSTRWLRSTLSFLDRFLQIPDRFLHITDAFLNLALGLMLQAFGLLLFAANQLAGFLLDLAGDVLYRAFYLILVDGHDDFLKRVTNSSMRTVIGSRSGPYTITARDGPIACGWPASHLRRLSFLTDFIPGTLRATSTTLLTLACELTKPLSCTTPLKVSTLISADFNGDSFKTAALVDCVPGTQMLRPAESSC